MLKSIRIFFNRLMIIFIGLIWYTSVMAETSLTHAVQNSPISDQAIARLHPSLGMHWQLLPGEDIPHIARLMFPSNATVREKFIRAVIHLNPELFPSGHYEPLSPGTMVQIPDLRTIHVFSAPASRKHPRAASSTPTSEQSHHSSVSATTDGNSHSQLLQLTMQLEQLSERQAHELNSLLQHTESLALQVADMQSVHTTGIQESSTQNMINLQSPEDMPPSPPPPLQDIDQTPSDLTLNTPNAEDLLSMDVLWILGALLIVLILIIVLRSYRRIQLRLTQESTPTLSPDVNYRRRFEALFMKEDARKNDSAENNRLDGASSEITNEARIMIKQGNSEQAMLFLQKHLAANSFDISGWLLLFELLYSQKNKSDFKKNARRFKRLGIFPDLWLQIQDLGHRLEADEPLYFDEQKRQERFFPDSMSPKWSSQLMK